jgi:hypothetical protein
VSGSHREGRNYVWTREMPNLRRTARRRRTAAAAHEGRSRPERHAALRRPLSTLWRVCSYRFFGERDGVPRVDLPRARTSVQRSTPRPDRAQESARLARRPRLSAFEGVDGRRPTSGPEYALSIMRHKLKVHVGLRQVSGIRARSRAFESLAPTERSSVGHSTVGRLDGRVTDS